MRRLTGILLACVIGISLFIGTARADTAFSMVVFKGNAYVISDTQIDTKLIGSKIGKVTSYSNREGETHSGNFSNQFPKGTEYYEIHDVPTKQAIAIKKSSQVFIKATYQGHYDGRVDSIDQILWEDALPFLVGGFFILILIIFFVVRNQRKRRGS